jgi:hypothetical protein
VKRLVSDMTISIYDCSSGVRSYYESEGDIYTFDGQRAFYIKNGQVFSPFNDRPIYYRGFDNCLYEHGSGRARFFIMEDK